MKHVPSLKAAALGAAVLLALAGCSGGGGGGSGGSGTLDMSVTDAPVDGADAVFVTFTGIELRKSGSDPIIIDFDEPVGLDLLLLQGDQSAFLIQGQELPAGVYDDVRLRVAGEANSACNTNGPFDSYIEIDGDQRPLIVPSGATSGYKVKGGITIAAGQRADYTVDFDLRKSIAERGSTGCYNLNPVLRVVDNAETGTLTGTVDAALLADGSCAGADTTTGAGTAVYVYEGAAVTPDDYDGLPSTDLVATNTGPDPLVTALLAPDGQGNFTYEVGFLLTGDYTVAFTCQAGSDVPPETVPPVEPETVESDNELVFVQPQTATITTDTVTTVNFTAAPPP